MHSAAVLSQRGDVVGDDNNDIDIDVDVDVDRRHRRHRSRVFEKERRRERESEIAALINSEKLMFANGIAMAFPIPSARAARSSPFPSRFYRSPPLPARPLFFPLFIWISLILSATPRPPFPFFPPSVTSYTYALAFPPPFSPIRLLHSSSSLFLSL